MTGWAAAVAAGITLTAALTGALTWLDHRELQATAARHPEGRRWP